MWLFITLGSAFFLGVYDIFKKISVKNNAVLVVLFVSTLVSFTVFTPLILASYFNVLTPEHNLYIPFSGMYNQTIIFIKSVFVIASWICSFYALKHLPISIVSPIRATAPVFTLFGALFILGESYNALQWLAIIIVLGGMYYFSVVGRKEGIHIKNNIWILLLLGALIFGSASSLTDKYLLNNLQVNRLEVQAWFSVYQNLILFPIVAIIWWPKRKEKPFTWRWSIPLIGVCLIISDFFLFYALSLPGSLITLVSLVRRSSVIISFAAGVFIFKEHNPKLKAIGLAIIVVGIVLLKFSK